MVKRLNLLRVPDDLLNNELLNKFIEETLPKNYNFECHKTIWRIKCLKSKKVALQMPEGLLLFVLPLINILKMFTFQENIEFYIFGDVTYGACCIDDISAKLLGVDLLVHYGHSCLVPVEDMSVLYIFVDIKIDINHFINSIETHLPKEKTLGFVSTVQFVSSLHAAKKELEDIGYTIKIPQSFPLSPGEILGCTSPKLAGVDSVIYLGDGRFHLESMMISNPSYDYYRYDPYSKILSSETYDHVKMKKNRRISIEKSLEGKTYGLILGTLGRQGNLNVLEYLEKELESLGKKTITILLSEIYPSRLSMFKDKIDVWIQIACPRLSIDWGMEFEKPLLTSYEASVLIRLHRDKQFSATQLDNFEDKDYPMDFYAVDSLGPWTPNHPDNQKKLKKKSCKVCNE